MTPIEIIALILIIVGIVKIAFVLISPKSWLKMAKKMWATPFVNIIFLILAAIVFYYLLREVSIAQILATSAFITLLMGVQFFRYSKETMRFAMRLAGNKKELLRRTWLYIIIWLILMVFGLVEIL